jgi:phospholipid transport system substrate-binding protein
MDVSYTGKRRGSVALVGRRALLRLTIFSTVAVLGLPRAATASAVTTPVEQLYAALPLIMRAGRTTPFRQRYDTLAPVIDRTFDLDDILKVSIGPYWPALLPEQRTALAEAFRRYTIATYVSNFDSFSGQRFDVQPNTTPTGAEQIVQTRIVSTSGETHRLDYVMRQIGGAWKVVDVLVDGSISRVAAQRSEIRSVMATGGGPALLDRLQRKIAEMSRGQLP